MTVDGCTCDGLGACLACVTNAAETAARDVVAFGRVTEQDLLAFARAHAGTFATISHDAWTIAEEAWAILPGLLEQLASPEVHAALAALATKAPPNLAIVLRFLDVAGDLAQAIKAGDASNVGK